MILCELFIWILAHNIIPFGLMDMFGHGAVSLSETFSRRAYGLNWLELMKHEQLQAVRLLVLFELERLIDGVSANGLQFGQRVFHKDEDVR